MEEKNKKGGGLLRNNVVQSLLASILCILLGLLVGYIALLIINANGAWGAIVAVVKNYFYYPTAAAQIKYMGSTLVKTAPLLLCSLSVLFAYKAGFFNIGAAGQYVGGAGASLYFAIALGMPWYVCILAAVVVGALMGAVSGALKAYRNVNEVISGIMLNWIGLYTVNMILTTVKEPTSPYTTQLSKANSGAIIPNLGLSDLFGKNQYVTIAIPLSVVVAIVIWVLLEKTKFGYELKATGMNKEAAKYCGMREKRNTIVTMAVAGGLAGMGAAFYYLSGIEQWSCTQTSVPAMGFNGIAAAFLGGLHPIGAVFSSYFIQHITSGGAYVDKSLYCSQISDFISAMIIYLCGFVFFFKICMNRWLDKRDEKKKKDAHQEGGEA
ncbi:MAG: ABC transporter permease [Clostridiales bacterium]|nr:ABC transporter permease [Clostridiales bacterium]